MRTAIVYNFLLESTLMASIAILLMLPIRRFLCRPLGSRMLCYGWLLVAIRLLCPLSLPNPIIHEIRSPFAFDAAIRPIAGQIRVRFYDLLGEMQWQAVKRGGVGLANGLTQMMQDMNNGMISIRLMWLYGLGAALVLAWFLWRRREQWRQGPWPVVRMVCCVVHWFNPLVWLAASLSRKDLEKNGEVGKTNRALQVAFATLATLALVGAFATSELSSKLPMIEAYNEGHFEPAGAQLEKAQEEEMIARAQEIWQSAQCEQKTDGLKWFAQEMNGHIEVLAIDSGDQIALAIAFAPDGELIYLCNILRHATEAYHTEEPRYINDPQKREELLAFGVQAVEALNPKMTALLSGECQMEEGVNGEHVIICAMVHGEDHTLDRLSLGVLAEPEVKLIYFRDNDRMSDGEADLLEPGNG